MASKIMPRTLAEEKQEIKKALRTPFNEGAIWQPLAIGWFEKWKTYVNFDDEVPEPRAKELIDSLHPGEIDNNSLQGSFGDEMRRDAVEGRDYVLMPSSYVNMLIEKYGGGPSYPRKVLNVGSAYNPIYQVNLFPIRIEVYFCDRSHPNPVQEEGRFLRRYFTKNMSLENIADDLLRANVHNSYSMSSRHWLRDTPPDATGRTRKDGSRLLTCDVVDFDGDWRFVRSDKHRNIQEVLGDRDCIELIVETVNYRNPRETDWPRYAQLESWKKDLRVGDMVDAKDRKGKFYSAKILHIDEAGTLLVHFIGWSASYDEKITEAEISSRIHPLHSNSFDRSTWEEGSKLDVCITDVETNPVWVTGTIISVDPMNDKVEVMVEAKERAEGLKKATTKSVGTANSNGFDDDEIDDDDSLKKKTTGNVSTTSLTAAMEEVKTSDSTTTESEENLRVWYDIYSDAIAPQYTHTQAARATYSTGGYGSLYGANYAMTVYNNSSSAYSSYDRHTKGTPPVAGAVGLQNLGNTCFMNSILQCLSNTQVLTEIFTSNLYKEQINYDNPLGHSGKIALTYGKLMKDVWSGAYIRIVPREFKTVIGEYRPQFAGYEQQDSQEMMSCLLDGLHEDLNRIHKKPYTQKIESKGRPDELIAAESWRRFLLRNDSLILEHFFGMQKSHVTCQKCGKESVTFDPYSALSLPIPIRNTRTIVTIVRLLPRSSAPLKVALEVELTATMAQLKKLLIDRLIELKYLAVPQLPEAAVAVAPPVPPVPPPAEDNGYELVDKADVTGVGKDYQMIVDDGELQTADLSSPPAQPVKGPVAAVKKPSIYDSFHFHFGMLYGTRTTTVFKNYNTQEARNMAIQAFVHKLDLLIAFELEHDLPEFKAVSNYSSSTYSVYGSTKSQKDTEEEEVSHIFGMDLCMGLRIEPTTTYTYAYTTSANQPRLELLGYPHRLSFERGVTNADIHRTVREVLRRTIPAESPLLAPDRDPTTWPYELAVTTTYGTVINRMVKDSEDTFVELKAGMEILVVYWLNTAITQGVVEINRAKELVEVDPTTPLDDPKSSDSLIEEEDDLDDDEFYPATVYQQQAKQKKSSGAQQGSNKRSKKSGISIYDCLDKYVEREQLADTETVYCNRCKEMLAPVKKMDLWTTPDVLILHLKRFQFLTGQYTVVREKITELVDFPIEGLDLSSYLQGPKYAEAPPVYDLFAVSHHMGGLGGGHYTATARNFLDNRWYNFNDSTVTPTDASSAVTATAYVLFYKRRTGTLKWAGAVPHPVGMPDEADD